LYRKINSLEAIANSGVLSDREIELEHGRVGLIPETKRLQNLEDIHNKIESTYDLLQVDEGPTRPIKSFLANKDYPWRGIELTQGRKINKLNLEDQITDCPKTSLVVINLR
jgi:hypothetical protein